MTALDPEITITGLRGRVAELIDTRDRLTRERDNARDEVVKLCQERLQLTAERDEARAAGRQLIAQREAVLKLISDAYTDAGADIQEGGAWPTWGPSIDALEVLEALGAVEGSGT